MNRINLLFLVGLLVTNSCSSETSVGESLAKEKPKDSLIKKEDMHIDTLDKEAKDKVTQGKQILNKKKPLVLYIKISYVDISMLINKGSRLSQDSMGTVSSEYFTVELSQLTDGGGEPVSYFVAKRKLESTKTSSKTLFITDEKGKEVIFSSREEFLDYMSQRDYDMIKEVRLEIGTDKEYTFKRK